ncbi:MAG TPA: hypothetical protein VIA07_10515 [Desulfuromonadales bacterium]
MTQYPQHHLALLAGGQTDGESRRYDLKEIFARMGVRRGTPDQLLDTLPFLGTDTTAGSETELQAAVRGQREDVDLPRAIEQSNYFANIVRRSRAGETPRRLITELEEFLAADREKVWENSWVRFPRRRLSPFADAVLRHDLLADKRRPEEGPRSDVSRFVLGSPAGEEMLRVPVSYLIKLALADAVGDEPSMSETVITTGRRLMEHYLSDNTSPETFSFHVVPLDPAAGLGRALARETAKRFLLTQLLTLYANSKFGLDESGQEALVCFAPHPPVRQKELNALISDSFYRELFMSPCLSGWDQGEKKHRYMHLCHQVLSRSQLHAVAKLREAGIIVNNLVVLPGVSNTSLANNGTHVSLGSRRLSALLGDPASGFGAAEEKVVGDLAIKAFEHFLPLFVGTWNAAPYRLAFADFHPEKALGFLPHQLDYTHLRMLWRRWRKKASLAVCGHSLTPFGPEWLDRPLSRMFGLKGDFVPDFRLIDYPVALLSTCSSPAFDGRLGNQERLKGDLADLGIFDSQMSLYLPCRQRQHAAIGFSGFEGRHYSLFPDLETDLGGAVSLQVLVTALAFKFMAQGSLTHRQIPDDPVSESERRQIFFGSAIGLPTFFVRRDTRNLFLRRILKRTRHVRASRRYPGYLRVLNHEYRRALLAVLLDDGADLVEALGLAETLRDLSQRLETPDRHAASDKLTRGILEELGARDPLRVPAREFNLAAEKYYRETLRQRQFAEGLALLAEDLRSLERQSREDEVCRRALRKLLPERSAADFLEEIRVDLLAGRAPQTALRTLIGLVVLSVDRDAAHAARTLAAPREGLEHGTPVHRAG